MTRTIVRFVTATIMLTLGANTGAAQATPPAAVERRNSFDLALVSSKSINERDFGYFGLHAQYTQARSRWPLLGVQATGFLSGPSGDSCESLVNGRCIEPPTYLLNMASLIGTGFHRGPFAVRALVGPRIAVGDRPLLAGAQVTADASLGGERVAMVIPLTWSWLSSAEQRVAQRTAGVGLQLRY